MNERIRELMTQADYAAPEIAKRAQTLVDLVILECMTVVSKKCASPTAYQALAEHFDIKD
jgi:hypothetical protein